MTDPNSVYLETCAAIDRFLTGDYNPTQLRSWLMVHFDVDGADEQARWLWTGVMTTLAIYGTGAFERADLEASIRQLRDSDNAFIETFRTPLAKQPAFHAILFSGNPPWPIRAGVHREEIDEQLRREGFREV